MPRGAQQTADSHKDTTRKPRYQAKPRRGYVYLSYPILSGTGAMLRQALSVFQEFLVAER